MRKTAALIILLAFGTVFFSSCGGSQKSKEIVISELTEPCDFAKAMLTYLSETIDLMEELNQMIQKVGDRKPTPSEEARAEAIGVKMEEIDAKVNELMRRADELGIEDDDLEACPENQEVEELLMKFENVERLFY